MTTPQTVLDFWFGTSSDPLEKASTWWEKNDDFDALIKKEFGDLYTQAITDSLEGWGEDPLSLLAHIIVLDQFSRNLFRENGRAWAQDEKALKLCLQGIENKFDEALPPVKRWFFYMPLEHSEDLDMQEKSLEMFEKLVKDAPEELKETFQGALWYAKRHEEVIRKFGRFPHRNSVLGRENTPEEEAYLKDHPTPFQTELES